MKFTRSISCSEEFASESPPEVLVVEIDVERARWIREMAAEVRRLKVHAIEVFDYSATWHKGDWDQESGDYKAGEDGMYPAPGEEFPSLDLRVLKITDDDFWWEAHLKGSSTTISCEPIAISELPE